MKKIFTLLTLTCLIIMESFGQSYVNYDRDSRWFIGLNGGVTWTTQTEVPYQFRGGYGLTFGKSYGMEKDKIFSWDLRARFLHAQVQGQATEQYALDSTTVDGLESFGSSTLQTYQDSLGYFIPNYRTNLLRGSAELVLNTNRLRQRTGWNLSVFGGIGITGYHTSSDLLQNGEIYDYENAGNLSASNLKDFQDNQYETDIVGDQSGYEVDWMPSFGFGISKQIHPAVALGLEHKMTWTRTNSFDGMPNHFNATSSTLNDKYHYTALTLKFHLFGGKRDNRVDVDDEPDVIKEDPVIDDFDPPVVTDPTPRKKPIVDIYDPNTSPYTTNNGTFKIRANIYYVDKRSKVTFKQDGNLNTNFSFNPSTNQFESTVVLHPGQNLFEITGVNDAGADYESVIIIYEKEQEVQNPPIVTITNPPYSPYFTNSNVFELVSTVLNVESKSNIRVYLNGVNLFAFGYGMDTKVLNASLNLIEGTNTVTVTATNAVGSDSKTVELIYRKPQVQQPPIVSFINPNADPYYTNTNSISIKASALHVDRKSDLFVKVNGNAVGSFSFNTSTKEILFNTGLIEGANIVEIEGVNDAGRDIATTTIIYTRPETPRPPVVTFIDPNTDPLVVYSATYNVTAKVEHVTSAANITLKINGVESNVFSYSTSSDLMTFTTSLVEGSNVIEVKGVNVYGNDIETTTIIYRKVIPQAPPVVDITYPAVDNEVFESANVTLVANVLNVSDASNINVLVNGIATVDFDYNTLTKVLTLPLVLAEGSNVIQITGTNVAGSDTDTRIIIYNKPVVPSPPTVHFTNPAVSPHLVSSAPFNLTASTTHIDAKSQIVLKQNGVLVADAAYDFIAGHQIVFNTTLIPGSNIFEVTVNNEDGEASDLAVINYTVDEDPCVIPTVGYIYPVPYSTVEDPNVTIDAQINNHSPETIVELKLNGVSLGFMTYSEATSVASKAITLTEGSNAITVIVTNDCGTNQATFTLNYEAPDAPCDDPVLVAGGSTTLTTMEETISLSLTATHVAEADELTVKLNGAVIPFAFDAGTGTIAIEGIELVVGVNSVVVTAKTDCGGSVVVYTITREVCHVPVISAFSHASGSTTESETIVFTANITNASADEITLLVNGVSQAFSFNEATGTLSEAIGLAVGENTIIVIAENACGTDRDAITVTRNLPCQPIVTNRLVPATEVVTATENTYTITLHTTGLTSVEQISAMLNGVAVSPAFDPVTGNVVLADLSLNDGANSVLVSMANACSETALNYVVNYKGCEPPVVVFNGITPGMTVENDLFNLGAVISNISDADDITLKLNGTAVDFDFNPVAHLLTATLTLAEGSNIIEIVARGCETVSQTVSLTYEEPCDEITHTLGTPASTTVTATEDTYTITLTTTGVENADKLTVKLNGAAVPFTFDVATGVVLIEDLALIDGANNVIVTMKNDCSSQVVNYTVNYEGCQPPVITFGSNPTETSESTVTFEANVSNTTDASEITFLLNGAPVPFVFDPTTGSLEASLTLNEGENVVSMTVRGCEIAKKSFRITYTIPCEPVSYTLSHPESLTVEVADPTYNISLIIENVSDVSDIYVMKGDDELPFTLTGNLVTINGIVLDEGTNTVELDFGNDCSEEVVTYTIIHDNCNTPEIDLSANALSSETETFSFVGSVSNLESESDLVVTQNGTPVSVSYDAASGTFTGLLTLVEGMNLIQVTANGCAKATASIRISYSKPCAPVTYTLVSPATTVLEKEEETVNIQLNTANVTAETIAVTVNGSTVAHTFTGGVIQANGLSLVEGSNVVTVTFGNECSSETVTYTISHKPCETPRILINGLADGATVVEQNLVLFASLYGVEDAGDITVQFNGAGVPFEFNAATHLLQVPLELHEGSNNIVIRINGCEDVNQSITVVYDPPCLAPTYSLVVPAETEITVPGATYTVSLNVGNVTEDQISVKINGATVPFTYASGTVIFEVPHITVPTNMAVVTLENDCGTVAVTYLITFGPIEEEEPPCMSHVSADFIAGNKTVVANSDKALSNVVLKFNDGKTQKFEGLSGNTGTFAGTGGHAGKCIVGVWIKSGCNESGDGPGYGAYVANDEWNGKCTEPCSPVNYNLITPNRLNVTTSNASYAVVFTANNLSNASGVSASINGVKTSVTYSGNRVTLSGIKLNKGVNVIDFNLANACSSERVVYRITYNPPVQNGVDRVNNQARTAPVIKPITPAGTKTTVNTQTLSLKASVLNVSGKSEIEMYVNGAKFPGFNYNSGNKQLSAIIRLNAGVNMVKIVANNGNRVEKTYYVTYQKVAQKQDDFIQVNKQELTPKLQRVNPTAASGTTSNANLVFKVRALNVSSKSAITLILNGTRVTNFSFNPSTKLVQATLRLRSGANTIKVTAKNGSRQANLTTSITYRAKPNNVQINTNTNGQKDNGTVSNKVVAKKPEFRFVTPTATKKTVQSANFLLKTKVLNIQSKSNLTLTLNGRSVTAFSYNATTKELIASLNLKAGTNTITITAKNGNQTARITYTITYSQPKVINSTIVKPGGTTQKTDGGTIKTGTSRR